MAAISDFARKGAHLFGNGCSKGWKVIKHPATKELFIFSIYLSCIIGGTICTGIFSHFLTPIHAVNLSGQNIWLLKTLSMGDRIRDITLLALGGAISGVGTFGLINRSFKKILLLKDAIDEQVEKRGPPSGSWLQKSVTWFFISSQKGMNLLHGLNKLLEHQLMKLLKYAIGYGLVVVGISFLILSVHYFVTLQHLATGVINGKEIVGFLVVEHATKLAIAGLSRGAGMAFSPLYILSKKIIHAADKLACPENDFRTKSLQY